MEENLNTESIREIFTKKITAGEAKMMHPLSLAYIGDAVYEIYIRKYLIIEHYSKVNELSKKGIKFVKATAQSKVVHELEDKLSDEEISIIKRGRNASPKTFPKNASLSEYKIATGFETLLGFLFLTGNNERLNSIVEEAIKITIKDKKA